MLKKYWLLFFFLCLTSIGFGQTKEIDSLKNELKIEKLNDTTRINIITAVTAKYISINLDSFKLYTRQALKLSMTNGNHKLSRIYCDMGIMKIMVDTEMDSARYYLDKALVQLDKNEDIATRAAVYSNYSMSYQNSSEFEKKIEFNLKAIDLLKNDHSRLCISHYNLAMIYSHVSFDSLTKKHLNLAIISAEKSKNKMVDVLAQRGLANFEIDEGKYESAKARLEKGLIACDEMKSPKVCLEINIELARLYHEIGKISKSKEALLSAKNYALKYNDNYDIMSVNMRLATQELNANNLDLAARYFEEFNEIYEKNPQPELGVDAFFNWSEVESKRGNHKKANALLGEYVKIRDSIFSVDNRTALANANEKYQSEKKDKEIAEQKLALADKELAITESKSKTRIMSILIVSLLSASILLWFLFQQRQKRIQQQLISIQREQEVRTLESLMEGEEKERFRIAKELHDGVNGDLSAIKFKLSSLLEMNNTVIKEAVTMIDNSCEHVRAISHNLVPPSLKNFNLVEAVEEYCQSMNSIHEPEVHFQQVGDPIDLDKKQEANLFRIIQELVTNSIKHADAQEINVQLSHQANTIQLSIEDNGKGFDPKTVKSDGIGMQNVQSRVDYLNAKIDFVSNEKGTSYTIEMNTKSGSST